MSGRGLPRVSKCLSDDSRARLNEVPSRIFIEEWSESWSTCEPRPYECEQCEGSGADADGDECDTCNGQGSSEADPYVEIDRSALLRAIVGNELAGYVS